ncbi:hypothetical protein GF412_03395 [Candidatus Micrarchaeota archaeon]|nr:hypothetical protein [Candidatus Micrarchaeota archaeon]MBD3417997.1 hypothetical protein [Candidatus Micrarchaeota archaeon]
MTTTRSSVPPAAGKQEMPGPAKARPRPKALGKKPGPDRNSKSGLAELKARQPLPGSFHDSPPKESKERIWRLDDTNPLVSEVDFEGACNCWGDNNRPLTDKEMEELTSAQTEP